MQHPTLLFAQNPSLDAEIAWSFFQHPIHGGENFWKTRALAFHESLEGLDQHPHPRHVLETYVRDLYQNHTRTLAAQARELEISITQSLPIFFQQTDRLFPEHPWPQQTCTAFFSVFNFCPRFLADGSFQLFLADTNEGALVTTVHELLHFIFYDFVKRNVPEFQNAPTESGTFWVLAELFNIVIQSTSAFVTMHGDPGLTSYKNLKPFVEEAKCAWTGDVLSWVAQMKLPAAATAASRLGMRPRPGDS